MTTEIDHRSDTPPQLCRKRADRGFDLRSFCILRIYYLEAAIPQHVGKGAGVSGHRTEGRLRIRSIADDERHPPRYVRSILAKGSDYRPKGRQQHNAYQSQTQHRGNPVCSATGCGSLGRGSIAATATSLNVAGRLAHMDRDLLRHDGRLVRNVLVVAKQQL